MPEYDFPSGRLTTAFDPMDWIKAIEAGLWCVLAVSIVILIWRCCRPASGLDLVGWVLFLVVFYCFLGWLATEDGLFPGEVQSFRMFMPLVAFTGIAVSFFRLSQHWATIIATGIIAFLGLQTALYPTVSTPREAARRVQCKNQLKQIGLAMHNHHDLRDCFPAAGNEGAGLTWRIMLLPFLDDEYGRIFDEFHLNEPWDSPHNTTLQAKRPRVYQCPSHPTEKRFTSYAMLRGPGTAGGDGTAGLPIKAMRDGTSNIALVVEACGREIVWTEPKDVEAIGDALGVNLPGDQPGRSRAAIASYHHGGAHVLLADGAVRFVSEKIDPHVIRLLSTYDDGEPVPEY